MKKKEKTIEDYLKLPWTYIIKEVLDKNGKYYIISVSEFPGVCTDSEDLNVGMELIKEPLQCAIEICIEKNHPVPVPLTESKCKGNISYRTDSRRHYEIANAANILHKSISKTIDLLVDSALKNLNDFRTA